MAGTTPISDIGQRMNFGNNAAKQSNKAPMTTKERGQTFGRQRKNANTENPAKEDSDIERGLIHPQRKGKAKR